MGMQGTDHTQNKRNDFIEVIWKGLLILFPYFLIFHLKICNGIIILLSCTALASAIFSRKSNFNFPPALWCSSIFLLSAAGIIYTTDLTYGLSLLDTRLPLILMPLIFFLKPASVKDVRILIKNFYLSLAAAFIVCAGYALYRNYLGPWQNIWFNQWYWHYTDFTEVINIHPLYLSLYVGFAILVILLDALHLQQIFQFSKTKKIAILFALMVFMVLLGSRWIIVVSVLTAGILLALSKRKVSIIWVAGILGVFVFLIALSPVTRERFAGTFQTKYEGSSYTQDRLVIWSVALNYVMKNPGEFIFGKGTGGSKNLMDQQYKEQDITWAFPKKDNTHNQYLGFLLDNGIIGLSWFVIFLFGWLRVFYKRKNWFGVMFILFFSLALIAENYLQKQKGVVFFSMIISCLALSDSNRNCKPHAVLQ